MAVFNNIIAGASGAAGAAGFQIDRSLRFNSADSAYLNRTPASAGNRKTWTWSGWVKRTSTSADALFSCGVNLYNGGAGGAHATIYLESSDSLQVYEYSDGYGYNYRTTQLFRDPGAWYHLVISLDTTNSTAADRLKIYVNGSRVTSFATSTAPALNFEGEVNNNVVHYISDTVAYLDGYLADVHFIDGQALAATDFGEYDGNNNWNPKAYSGTYGTNGFHLDFSDNSSNAALGYDAAGSNDWTVNNLTASGTKWSSYLIPQSPATFDSSYPASEAFDGSIAANQEARLNSGSYADRYIDFIPTGGIAFSNQIEMYVGATNFEYSYNGGSNVAVTAGAWHTVASGGGTLTSIRIQRTQTLTHTWRALRVDGTILVDGDPAGTDSLIDTPTNYEADSGNNGGNYATLNPLLKPSGATLSDGNLEFTSSSNYQTGLSTIGMSSGKWYFEASISVFGTDAIIGIVSDLHFGPDYFPGSSSSPNSYGYEAAVPYLYPTNTSGYSTYTTGDIIGVAYDADNGKIYFAKNGVWGNSSDPVNGTNPGFTGITGGPHFFAVSAGTNGKWVTNFGQRPFAYTPPTGYVSLCTTNLPDPTIADGSTAFDVDAYTGNGSTQERSEFSFEPDLVWIKARSAGYNHYLVDQVRGFNGSNARVLQPNLTNAEESADGPGDAFASFDDDGFTVKLGTGNWSGTNQNNVTYVAWAWDAGTSTVSNTDGSITASVRANPSAGFSIVTWTGNSGTVAHGLNAAPGLIISKIRNTSSAWPVQHSYDTSQFLTLNTADAASSDTTRFGAAPTSSVFSVGSWWNSDSDGVAYVFSPVEGYSKFGSYQGNGSSDGPMVYTGFRPAFLLIKRTDASSSWYIFDSARSTFNVVDDRLQAHSGNAENTNAAWNNDFLSNGFKLRTTEIELNNNGSSYIYAAFAEHPFKTSRAR